MVAEVAPGVALDALMTGLSGGQAARVGLAALLLSRYDVLLLDEPTNDLDLAGLDQLERFVAGARAGIVLVSHDREFLARTVTRVVELDLAQQLVRVHDGGYEAYLVEREVARRHAREEFEEFADTKAGLEARARMQRNWMAKGVRDSIKKSKDGDKHIKAHNRATSEKQGAKAKQTDRRIERLEVVEEPRKEWELRLEIAAAPRAGAVVATLRGAVVRRGRVHPRPGRPAGRLGRPDRDHRRERLGQVDPAGRAARAGSRWTRGRRPSGPPSLIGEIDQARGRFFGPEQLIDAFSAEVPDWPTPEVRTLLAKFGLTADHVLRPAETLSPGERTRAALALLQARGHQRARARRADQPPRPARHRAARGGAGRLLRHAAAGHPRPADARAGADQPAARGGGREGHRALRRARGHDRVPARVPRTDGRVAAYRRRTCRA